MITYRKTTGLLMLGSIFILSGCSLIEQGGGLLHKGGKAKSTDVYITESIEISVACNKNSIESYLENGWKITSSVVSEVPCTWKTTKANKKCNIKRDKGCSITVPDKMGKKTTYTLIKKVKSKTK
ncbi:MULTISPECIES: hypothetical protein [unclassified Prochlorococcus]|uniref:hypothetical protein n=1 Tax=unclassified Prochlorococcus TaxID=2627481 RepID=UPI0005339A6A|nr:MULTISPECIES: hypothetical protein [unclassified Prochlorococcus]KGG17507.1 putative Alpha-2-macroglobulin family N-termin [Prochlorococcus sp. MIT 0603]